MGGPSAEQLQELRENCEDHSRQRRTTSFASPANGFHHDTCVFRCMSPCMRAVG